MKKTTYNGNDLYYNKHEDKNLSFGLYAYSEYIKNPKTAMKNIKKAFISDYKSAIIAVLDSIGLKYHKMNYFSPSYYNYSDDSLDLTLSVKDIEKYQEAIKANEAAINELLAANKSYDGYMALTVDNVNEEIEKSKNNYYFSPDPIVINYFLRSIDFSDFNIDDYINY